MIRQKPVAASQKSLPSITYMWLLSQTFGDNLGNKLRDVNGSCRRQLKWSEKNFLSPCVPVGGSFTRGTTCQTTGSTPAYALFIPKPPTPWVSLFFSVFNQIKGKIVIWDFEIRD